MNYRASPLKRLIFGAGRRFRPIWLGHARGLRFAFDPERGEAPRIVGLFEWELQAPFVSLARQAGSLLDVGAAEGYYAVWFRKLRPSCPIRAVEPESARHRADFLASFAENQLPLDAVQWWEQPLGAGPGTRTLAEALDGLPAPVLLKLDVEEAEDAVYQSGRAALAQARPLMLVETHSLAFEALLARDLTDLGYAVRIIDPAWWRLGPLREMRTLAHNRWLIATP